MPSISPKHASPDRLGALLAAATGEASSAMSRWTGQCVGLELDEVAALPLEECQSAAACERTQALVVVPAGGDLGGTVILAFAEAQARVLAAALLREPPRSGLWTELEASALCETGNILACAYLAALGRHLEGVFAPWPPTLLFDYPQSVLETALMEQAVASDEVLVCRTSFQGQQRPLGWDVYFVPSATARERMDQIATTFSAGVGA